METRKDSVKFLPGRPDIQPVVYSASPDPELHQAETASPAPRDRTGGTVQELAAQVRFPRKVNYGHTSARQSHH